MVKRKSLVRTYSNVAVLDGISKTQFLGQVLVRQAKARFAHLNDSRLEEAAEDWQAMDVLRIMYDEYNCSMNPEDATIAYELGKFITKHGQ